MPARVFVRGSDLRMTTEEALMEHFGQCGPVLSVKMKRYPINSCVITFESPSAAELACSDLARSVLETSTGPLRLRTEPFESARDPASTGTDAARPAPPRHVAPAPAAALRVNCRVTWTAADDDIPAGHEGVVLEFLKDAGRVRVKFPNGTWNIKPHELRVVEAPPPPPGPPSANGRTEQLCSYFQRGHCRNGERCQFVHGGEQLAAPIGEAVADAVFVCKLDWGATRAEVKSLFERAGAVKGVDFLPRGAGTDSRRGQCAVVHFRRAADASHAIATLDNATFVPSDTSSGRRGEARARRTREGRPPDGCPAPRV